MSTNRILLPSVLALGAVALVLTGCAVPVPPGPVVSEERIVAGDVHAVVLATSGNLDVVIGDETTLTISAPAPILDRLTSDSAGGVLTLGTIGGELFNAFDSIRYTLTLPLIDALELVGSGDAEVDFTGAENVDIRVDGSGDVRAVGIDADAVRVDISGSGDATVSGAADDGEFTVVGSGDLDASELRVGDGAAESAVPATCRSTPSTASTRASRAPGRSATRGLRGSPATSPGREASAATDPRTTLQSHSERGGSAAYSPIQELSQGITGHVAQLRPIVDPCAPTQSMPSYRGRLARPDKGPEYSGGADL